MTRTPEAKIARTVENEQLALGPSRFGALLRHHRLAAGLSQEALAERARMSTDGISALERGYRRTPQRETLALLTGALALNDEQRRVFEMAAARWELLRRPGEGPVAIGPWPGAGTSILPIALTSFVGREVELGELSALVRQHRLVTVTGPGGVGKTQMALHVGTVLSEATNPALCFVTLAPVGDPSLVVTAVASALGLQEAPNHPLLDTLIAYLRNKTMLLILDNCEHVILEARTVAAALLLNCPRVRILATSRELLRVADEHAYRLPSLSVPPEATHRIAASDASEYAAVVLFVDRARAVDHHFTLTDENAPIVAELCRGLDGIPLAIELAAARTNVLSVRALAKRLDDRLRVLNPGEQRVLPRQQTMRATIGWSYELLSTKEQRVLERLSVFVGGCTLATAAAICAEKEVSKDNMLDVLSSLVEKSLVIADLDVGEPRYRLLEPFREYAREKLATRGELEDAVHRHAFACLELSEQLQCSFDSEPDAVWGALVREELSNWRAALHWALMKRGDVLLGQQLVSKLNVAWQYFARVEGRRWNALALELVDDRTPPSVFAGLTYGDAIVAWLFREYKRALASCEAAIVQYRALGDSVGVARAQNIACVALFSLGRVAEAEAQEKEVLRVVRATGDQRQVAFATGWLGVISAHQGNAAQARRYIADAMRIWDLLGATVDATAELNNLAEVEFQAGNTELAVRHAKGALERCGGFDDPTSTMDIRSDLTRYLILAARYKEAETQARETLDFARERLADVFATFALQHLGAIAALRPLLVAESTADVRSRAARILGFSDARITAMGSARQRPDQLVYDRALAALREAIGGEAIAGLMAEGAAMTEEQAVEEALTL